MNYPTWIPRHPLLGLALAGLALCLILAACENDDDGGNTFVLPTPHPLLHPSDSTLVLVPGGEVILGNTPDGWGNYQSPENPLPVDSFYIERWEVSNQQYAAYLTAAWDSGLVQYDGEVREIGTGQVLLRASAPESHLQFVEASRIFIAEAGYETLPVVCVSWYGARAYAEFYGRRLPTEAEWEKAARGTADVFGEIEGVGVGYPYPWGDAVPQHALANFNSVQGSVETVYSYSQGMSWYGAFNMAGNVWEWSATASGGTRVRRGGSYLSSPEMLLTASRYFSDPTLTDRAIGFRCVQDP